MTPQRILSLIVAMMAAAFLGDLVTPPGIAGGVPYIIPVALSLRLPGRRPSVFVALAAMVLILLGLVMSPIGATQGFVLVNRTYAMIAIGVVAVLGWCAKDAANTTHTNRLALIAS